MSSLIQQLKLSILTVGLLKFEKSSDAILRSFHKKQSSINTPTDIQSGFIKPEN